MEDIKEVKSVHLISFTLIASSTAAILAFIYAIIILFISGILVVFIPQVAGFKDVISGLGVASLIISAYRCIFSYYGCQFIYSPPVQWSGPENIRFQGGIGG